MKLTLDDYWHLIYTLKCEILSRHKVRNVSPEKFPDWNQKTRAIISLSRKLQLELERHIDREIDRKPCRNMAALRARNAEYKTRSRVRSDIREFHWKFIPVQKAA